MSRDVRSRSLIGGRTRGCKEFVASCVRGVCVCNSLVLIHVVVCTEFRGAESSIQWRMKKQQMLLAVFIR